MATDTRASYVGKNGIVKGAIASSEDILRSACGGCSSRPAGMASSHSLAFSVLNVPPRKIGDAVL
jgi:hypothetical protein